MVLYEKIKTDRRLYVHLFMLLLLSEALQMGFYPAYFDTQLCISNLITIY